MNRHLRKVYRLRWGLSTVILEYTYIEKIMSRGENNEI